jgi:tetratricopeptide (TPR) repeat protein
MLAGLVLAVSGCQLLNFRTAEEPDPTPEPELEQAEAVPAASVLSPATMQVVIDLLDTGQLEQAEQELLRIIDARPGSRLALRFLEQIQVDPVDLMGEEYDEVVVERGESLSVIAHRELGDGMQFFALARYNDIAVPRRLSPGMVIKIPSNLKSDPELPVTSPEAPLRVAQTPGAGLALAGQQLLDAGKDQQAVGLLLSAARAGNLDEDGERMLARAGIVRSRSLAEDDGLMAALELLDEVSAQLGSTARAELTPERNLLMARVHYQEGIHQRRAGRLPEALELFERAVTLDAEFEAAAEEAANLRQLMVVQLHERALTSYREQQLSEAIALWEEVLDLNPDFQPALVYLPRARALQSRLSELEND